MFKIKDAWQIVEAPPADEGTWVDARDGQVYPWKKLGNQTWMTVNFNYGGKSGDWVNTPNAQSAGHAYRFQNQQDYGNYEAQGWTFGAYYTLASLEWAVPDGWHVPTRDEINTLKTWAMETYGSGASGNVTAQMLGNAALMNSCSNLWSSYGLKVPANKHNLTGFNLCINSTGWSGSGWGSIYTPGAYNFTNNTYLWLADANGSSQYFLNVSEDSQYSYNGPNISISSMNPGSRALPIRLIKDAEVSTTQPIITDIVTSLDSTGSDNKIATEKATRSAITSAVSSKMSNPMTTAGDIIVGGTSGAPSRLASGTTGQILKVGSNGLEWGAETGQALYLGAFDSRNRPQNATTGQFILDTDLGYMLYRYGSAWINSTGTVYEGNVTPSANDPVQWLANPMSSAGDLIVGGSSGSPSRLAQGSEGDVLTVSGGGTTWSAPSGKTLVSASDTASGYLGAKLTAGSNVTIITQTDGDGVQTLEISAAGGGGGGGSYVTQFAPILGCGFCQYVFPSATPGTWPQYTCTFLRRVPFVRKWSRVYIFLTGLPAEYTSANVGLYYRDTSSNFVAASLQTGLTIKTILRSGANTNDSYFYVDLDAEMDTTDGSRNYKLAFQLVATTKPGTMSFYPDNSFLKSPITNQNAWTGQNDYTRLYANNDIEWGDIWLSKNNYWAQTTLTNTLTNIPTASSSEYQMMPWMAVE